MTRKQREAREALIEYVRESGCGAGDQLESFHDIARSIGVSVNLLQKVVPALKRDGILTVVPRVGTFLAKMPRAEGTVPAVDHSPANREIFSRSLIPPGPGDGKTQVRLFVAESGMWARACWRRIVAAFEEDRPDIHVQFSMSAEESGPVAGADVVVLELGALQQLSEGLAELGDGFPEASELVEPLADPSVRWRDLNCWPVMFGTTLLFANRRLLSEAGLFEPDRWRDPMAVADTCESHFNQAGPAPDVLGWALHDIWAPLLYMGFSRRQPEELREQADRYVRLVAHCPPPRLVTLADARRPGFLSELLVEGKTLFVTGYSYHNALIDPETWEALPPPISAGGVPPLGVMAVGVRKNAGQPEAGSALARFLAGPKAQDIMASSRGSLPAMDRAAREHVIYPAYESQTAGGWLRESLDPEAFRSSRAMSVLRALGSVRTRGLDPDEVLQRVLDYPAGSEFTEVWPARAKRRNPTDSGRKRRPVTAT